MSYLNALRLHFAGRFQANVSTVNNDPAHFDNAAFKASYQEMQGSGMQPPNGWFNPQGDACFRLLGCRVTSAFTSAGPSAASDPISSCIVADSDDRVPAKLVDLDSEQQLVSEIWGLQVRIATASGETLLLSSFDPAAFIDIWDRSRSAAGGDTIAGAMYQSTLTNLVWSDVSSSPFLSALKAAAVDGLLSIKFNVDSFNMDFTSPDFMTGRIVGTIGPALASEPRYLTLGRQFMAAAATGGNFFKPAGQLNFCAGVVDAGAGCMYLDLGNALPTGDGGGMCDLGDLTLSVNNLGVYNPGLTPPNPVGSTIPIGTLPSQGAGGYASAPDWYARTAGVVVFPISAGLIPLVQNSSLSLSGTTTGVVISEWPSGAFVRADRYVYRSSPGERAQIPVYAMQLGRPLAGASIAFVADPSQLQPTTAGGFPYVAPGPAVAAPESALRFENVAVTDHSGLAMLVVDTLDPGTPRYFNKTPNNPSGDYGIDGQVYGIRPKFADTEQYGDAPTNQWNFVSLLLWSGYRSAPTPTWTDVQPIFQQYANLYPVMNRFLDMGNYDSVVAHAGLLKLAFGLNPADPNSMPVTRDLSPAKRATILRWLDDPLPGTALTTLSRGAVSEGGAVSAGSALEPRKQPRPEMGGKASAAARRLVLRSK